MNKPSNAILAAALLAGAAIASAQPSAERFADQHRVWQAYSSGSIVWQFRSPATPVGNAPSSAEVSAPRLPARDSFEHTPSFAQLHRDGLSFEYYQALASNSDAFKFAPEAGQPAFATATGGSVMARKTPEARVARVARGTADR